MDTNELMKFKKLQLVKLIQEQQSDLAGCEAYIEELEGQILAHRNRLSQPATPDPVVAAETYLSEVQHRRSSYLHGAVTGIRESARLLSSALLGREVGRG